MGMRMNVSGMNNLTGFFVNARSIIGDSADDALQEFAEELKEELESTSPVDSGEYKGSWGIQEVSNREIIVYNSAEYARFVGLPNRKMVGASGADDPSEGILHDVEAIAYSQRSNMKDTFTDHLSSILS